MDAGVVVQIFASMVATSLLHNMAPPKRASWSISSSFFFFFFETIVRFWSQHRLIIYLRKIESVEFVLCWKSIIQLLLWSKWNDLSSTFFISKIYCFFLIFTVFRPSKYFIRKIHRRLDETSLNIMYQSSVNTTDIIWLHMKIQKGQRFRVRFSAIKPFTIVVNRNLTLLHITE